MPSTYTKPPPKTTKSQLLHICENCSALHLVYTSELKRGRGIFCCLSCARQHSHTKPTKTTCQNCGNIFYTRL